MSLTASSPVDRLSTRRHEPEAEWISGPVPVVSRRIGFHVYLSRISLMSLRLSSLTAIAGLALVWGSAHADPVSLDPSLSIGTPAANGVHAVFRSVGSDSLFSTVY